MINDTQQKKLRDQKLWENILYPCGKESDFCFVGHHMCLRSNFLMVAQQFLITCSFYLLSKEATVESVPKQTSLLNTIIVMHMSCAFASRKMFCLLFHMSTSVYQNLLDKNPGFCSLPLLHYLVFQYELISPLNSFKY